jgi:hypothetical protein
MDSLPLGREFGAAGGSLRRQRGRAKLNFSYDPVIDVLTIENVSYSGELFRRLAQPDDGALYRLRQNENRVVIIERMERATPSDWDAAFDAEAGPLPPL